MSKAKEEEKRVSAKKKKEEKTAAGTETHEDRVKELEEKLASEKDSYLRLMAEFDNYRRRSSEERLNLIGSAAADTIKGLLPVLDDCENALKQLGDGPEKEGVQLIFDKLLGYLKGKGLEPIEAKGTVFDTDFHEAVTQFPAPDESMKGKVMDVVQTGYLLKGKVLRYAKVVVGQ